MKEIKTCPFCGAENTIIPNEEGDGRMYCKECETIFDEKDVEFEEYRHKISAICSSFMTTEEQSLKCEIILDTPEHKDLTPENKTITEIFQGCAGIIWIKKFWEEEPKEIDTFSLDDVKFIYENLVEQNNEGSLSLAKTKEETKNLIKYREVEKINDIISEACSKIHEVAWEKLRIDLDGDMEEGILDTVYRELKTYMNIHA